MVPPERYQSRAHHGSCSGHGRMRRDISLLIGEPKPSQGISRSSTKESPGGDPRLSSLGHTTRDMPPGKQTREVRLGVSVAEPVWTLASAHRRHACAKIIALKQSNRGRPEGSGYNHGSLVLPPQLKRRAPAETPRFTRRTGQARNIPAVSMIFTAGDRCSKNATAKEAIKQISGGQIEAQQKSPGGEPRLSALMNMTRTCLQLVEQAGGPVSAMRVSYAEA
jgi:hypothetical protein